MVTVHPTTKRQRKSEHEAFTPGAALPWSWVTCIPRTSVACLGRLHVGCEEFVVRERVSRAELPSMSWLKDRAAWVEAMQLKEQEKLSTLACRGQTVQ